MTSTSGFSRSEYTAALSLTPNDGDHPPAQGGEAGCCWSGASPGSAASFRAQFVKFLAALELEHLIAILEHPERVVTLADDSWII